MTTCALDLSHLKAVLNEVTNPIGNWDKMHQALEDTQSSLLNWDAIYDALGDIQVEFPAAYLKNDDSASEVCDSVETITDTNKALAESTDSPDSIGSKIKKKATTTLSIGCKDDESGYQTDNEDNGDNGSGPIMMVRTGNSVTKSYSYLNKMYSRRIIQNILSWINKNTDNLPSTRDGWVNLIRSSKLQKIEFSYDIGTLMHIILHETDIFVSDKDEPMIRPLLEMVRKFMNRHSIDSEESISKHLDVYQRYLGSRCKLTIWVDPAVIVELLYRMHILTDVTKIEWSPSKQGYVSKKRCRSSIEEIVEDGDEVFNSTLKYAVREVNSTRNKRLRFSQSVH